MSRKNIDTEQLLHGDTRGIHSPAKQKRLRNLAAEAERQQAKQAREDAKAAKQEAREQKERITIAAPNTKTPSPTSAAPQRQEDTLVSTEERNLFTGLQSPKQKKTASPEKARVSQRKVIPLGEFLARFEEESSQSMTAAKIPAKQPTQPATDKIIDDSMCKKIAADFIAFENKINQLPKNAQYNDVHIHFTQLKATYSAFEQAKTRSTLETFAAQLNGFNAKTKSSVETHRGFCQLPVALRVVLGILLAAVTAGLGALIAHAASSAGFGGTFFGRPNTDTQKKAQGLNTSVEEAVNASVAP